MIDAEHHGQACLQHAVSWTGGCARNHVANHLGRMIQPVRSISPSA
jgi:hypothetical protein